MPGQEVFGIAFREPSLRFATAVPSLSLKHRAAFRFPENIRVI